MMPKIGFLATRLIYVNASRIHEKFISVVIRSPDNLMITRPCNLYHSQPTFLYSKTGVYRGIHFFLILGVGTRKKGEKYHNFLSENYHFYSCEKSQYIA